MAPPASGKGAGGGGGQAKYGNKRMAKALREVYEEGCVEYGVSANSALLNMLPDKVGVALPGDTLDLSRNFVGDRGLTPVLGVVQRCPTLRTLVLSDNGLRNAAVRNITAALRTHPGVTALDLSDNMISEGAGVALGDLVQENRRVTVVNVNNTKVPAELRLKIKQQITANQQEATGA